MLFLMVGIVSGISLNKPIVEASPSARLDVVDGREALSIFINQFWGTVNQSFWIHNSSDCIVYTDESNQLLSNL